MATRTPKSTDYFPGTVGTHYAGRRIATRTPVDALRPETKDRIQRERIEHLRQQGRYRDLVLWMLGYPEPWQPEANGVFQTRVIRARPPRRMEPSRADLMAADRESSDPLPASIRDYIMTHYVSDQALPLKTGRKTARATADDDRVLDFYARAYLEALDAHEADEGPNTRDIKTQAKDRTGKAFGISPRTIDGILAARRLLKSPPK